MALLNQVLWVGIDVSKHSWDVAIANSKHVQRFDVDPTGCQQLIAMLREEGLNHIYLEATGGYEQELVAALHEQWFQLSIVNPRQVRDFARVRGQLAKTDRIDALMIADFATRLQPALYEKPSENQEKLRSTRARRQQVTDALVREKNRLRQQRDPDARRSVQQAVDFHQEQLEALNQQIERLMYADEEFQKRQKLLLSVSGVGKVTAAGLIAEMPELGALNRGQAGRLAGLAPINRDSGRYRGKRMIGGGRVSVRKVLYMAPLVATKSNPLIRDFYQHLLEKGKSKMTALAACMRKLLLILNAILRENKPSNVTHNT